LIVAALFFSQQIEVHQKFRCVPETLYLTINIIDRYLELEPVERSNLQLVGVTALLVNNPPTDAHGYFIKLNDLQLPHLCTFVVALLHAVGGQI